MTKRKQLTWWEEGVKAGWIELYEQEMVRFLELEFGPLSDEEKLCAVFVSLFLKAGHTCLPIQEKTNLWAQDLGLDPDDIRHLPKGHVDISALQNSRIIGELYEMKPFALHQNLLSFRKVKNQEEKLLQWVAEKHKNNSVGDISKYIGDIFPEKDKKEVNWQKVAAVLSLISPFLIISGGPGTGKTTTVARLLVLHQKISDKPLKIALAAPTGKAAGRMGEALAGQLASMDLSEQELRQFPTEAKTIHRLLSGTEERGLLPPVEKKLLRYDLVIIDEASMIDLSLMHRLIRHLSPKTRIILLGDKDQLASVEAGSVFADLCQKQENGFLDETARKLWKMGVQSELPVRAQSRLDDSIVYLTKSYRFGPDTGIGALSETVKKGENDEETITGIFNEFEDLEYNGFHYQKQDFEAMIDGLIERVEAAQKLKSYEDLMVFWKESIWLSVLRRGMAGSDRLNSLVEQKIASRLLAAIENGWYQGRPVIITQNDYSLGLFNGDLGVCLKDQNGELWLYVESGAVTKKIKPGRVLHFDPAYFLTVHKSQGSEFDHVQLLLPRHDNPLMTRELIYTAITRAKQRFSLFGDLQVFTKGIDRQTRRYTGLRKALSERV